MHTYNPIYRKLINEKNVIPASKMVRAKFYLIKEYHYVDGDLGKYGDQIAPIIFTLFVSKTKDIVHAVKVNEVRPDLIKRFFSKFVNEDTELLEMKGSSRQLYEKIVSKVPIVKNDSYRTYKLSGLRRIFELEMDVSELTTKTKNAVGIDNKSQKQNK